MLHVVYLLERGGRNETTNLSIVLFASTQCIRSVALVANEKNKAMEGYRG